MISPLIHFRQRRQPDVPAGAVARIPAPELRDEAGRRHYQWEVLIELKGEVICTVGGAWFRTKAPIAPQTGLANAALAASILPLMALGLQVKVDGGVSPRLLRNLMLFQSAFSRWYPGLTRVPIDAPPPGECDGSSPDAAAPTSGDGSGREAVLFSLGVDSWYSVLKHSDHARTLLFIDGFDQTLEQVASRQDVRELVEQAAAAVGCELVVVESNLRDWLDRWVDWKVSHGSFLGAVNLLMEGVVDMVHVPSSALTGKPDDCGSNPLTDPLFSTERLVTAYDAGDRQRTVKLAWLLEQPIAMDHLRVCWSGTDRRRNCGRCPKCLRTMCAIHLLGDLRSAPLFPAEVDLESLAKVPIGPGWLNCGPVILDFASKLGRGGDPVALTLERRLAKYEAELLLEPEEGALGAMTDKDWKKLARQDREALAADLMSHAPQQVNEALAPRVPKIGREVLGRLWQQDRGWLMREFRKLNNDAGSASGSL